MTNRVMADKKAKPYWSAVSVLLGITALIVWGGYFSKDHAVLDSAGYRSKGRLFRERLEN